MDEPESPGEAYAFGPFRVDVEERLLERDGEPLPLRAKVFDTLVALLRRPGRLVTRQELIETVWPDAIVEEGNLSHNVSALRRALGDERPARYVETVPRRGYRFVHPVERTRAAERGEDELERARRFVAGGSWSHAYDALRELRRRGPLAGRDQAALAEAARWSGHEDEVVPLLEEAGERFRREGDSAGAARAVLDLAGVLLDRRRLALASSYLRQVERLLGERRETPEEGVLGARLLRLQGRLRWAEGDWEAALELARRAAAGARRHDDADAEVLALVDVAHGLLALERFAEAAAVLDEAGAVLTAGEVSSASAGLAFCGLVFAWRACGRWDRAAEWIDLAVRRADGDSMTFYPGLCRVHRGELVCLRGDLEAAEADLATGTAELARADSVLAGPGLRELGTVRLRRGDLPGAEQAFARALEFGTDPQPGLALLHAARGDLAQARRELERFLSEEGDAARNLLDRENRFLALSALPSIALATGDLERAREAAASLGKIADATGSATHRAAAEDALGAVALAEADPQRAIVHLRSAWRGWSELPAPYEAACVRERLAEALVAVGDVERARMELEGAAGTFERLGVAGDLDRVRARLELLAAGPATGARELVACGEIADRESLRRLVGEEAWGDLVDWLGRRLERCWQDHGGRALRVAGDGTYAVSFDDLESSLRCLAHVHESLREHRARHGFAPALRLALVQASPGNGGVDREDPRRLAERLLAEAGAGEVRLAVPEDVAEGCRALERLEAVGLKVELVPGS